MEFFTKILKNRDSKYGEFVDESNKKLKKLLLKFPQDFKPRYQGRIWLVCKCENARCAGFKKDKFTARRLLRIINFYNLQDKIDQNLLGKIKEGDALEPAFTIIDFESYDLLSVKLINDQDTFQIIRRLKSRR